MAIYVVAEGDTLSAIAEAHGSSLAEIISLNPQIANPDLIHPGQEVNVPGAAEAAPAAEPTGGATAAVTASADAATEVAPAPEEPAASAADPASAPTSGAGAVLEGRLAE